jgi:hypothetical protein
MANKRPTLDDLDLSLGKRTSTTTVLASKALFSDNRDNIVVQGRAYDT